VLTAIVLPATVPHIVTGARLAWANSFLTIVSAEIVAADTGIGALIWQSRNYGRVDWIFVGIIVLGLLGFTCDRPDPHRCGAPAAALRREGLTSYPKLAFRTVLVKG